MLKLNDRIRVRILFLTIATLVPVLILIFALNINQLKISKEAEIQNLQNIANSIASENTQIVEGVRQLLVTLSVTPEVRMGGNACSNYLSNLLAKYQRYGNFGVSDLKGNVKCSAVTPPSRVNLSDRFFFKETLRTNDFSIGEYVVSRTTNQSSINFGYPLENGLGVVYATLSLNWLSDFLSTLEANKEIVVLVLDKNGVILARSPGKDCDCVGKEFPRDPLVNSLVSESGVIGSSGIDGVKRIYAYKRIGEPEPGIYLAVGKSQDEIYKTSRQYFSQVILFSILTAILSIIVGFYIGNWLIAKSIEGFESIERLKHDFVSLVSHQLRTPTTAIKWFTQILLSESSGKLNKKQKSLLKDSLDSTQRMTGLVTTLLQIARLESGKIKAEKVSSSLLPILKSIIAEIKPSFKDKELKVDILTKSNVPKKVLIDPKLIRQCLTNLIHNAFKYSKVRGKILIAVSKEKDKLQIVVTDFGIGVPKKEKGVLFKKFSRASNAKVMDGEGAGLGLYLVKLIVDAHGGKVNFVSSKNKTSFYVTIPLE